MRVKLVLSLCLTCWLFSPILGPIHGRLDLYLVSSARSRDGRLTTISFNELCSQTQASEGAKVTNQCNNEIIRILSWKDLVFASQKWGGRTYSLHSSFNYACPCRQQQTTNGNNQTNFHICSIILCFVYPVQILIMQGYSTYLIV